MKYDHKKNRWKTDKKVFLASDHHFGHKNIVEYDGRPFKNVQEMDEILILNHNSVVSPDDVVIFAGDFALEGYPTMVISHYAHRTWHKQNKGYWHLYGHSHGNLQEDGSLSFDIGVNSHNYFPWSMQEIAAKVSTKKIKIVDHHKGDAE